MPNSLRHLISEDQEEIETLEAASNDFMIRILGLEPGQFAFSDMSELCDFSCFGLEDGADEAESALSKDWDSNIIARIKAAYDIDVPSTSINMVTLLAQVDAAMRRRIH